MNDEAKTREQLISEWVELRKRSGELAAAEAGRWSAEQGGKQAEKALRGSVGSLRGKVGELSTVSRIDRAILSAFDEDAILDMLCTQFIEVCGFRCLMIALVDKEAGVIRVVIVGNSRCLLIQIS